jgi:hypothetical protein
VPRLYWPTWALATATTGLVGGFFLGHALLLGRFIDWLLTSGRARTLAETYPVFRQGTATLDVFYAIAGLQVLAGLAFAIVCVVARRTITIGLLAGLLSVSWPVVHYASGFGAIEASVLRSTTEAPRHVVEAFVTYNTPVHLYHVGALLVALAALLAAPATTRARD